MMIYEMRVYHPHDGKGPAMRERFLHHALPALGRTGTEVVEVFAVEASEDVLYIVRFADEAARVAAAAAFRQDSAWIAAKQATEIDGPLLQSQTVTVLHALV